jgi:subfamily B ATP-binding cassette protein MsbA
LFAPIERLLRPNESTGRLVWRILSEYVAPLKGRVVLALAAMVLIAGSQAAIATLMEPIVNWIFVERQHGWLMPLALAVVGAFAIKGIATYVQAVQMTHVGQRITTQMQKRLFTHLLRLDLPYFQRTPSGTLMSRFVLDMNMMRSGITAALTGIGKDSLMVLFLVAVMFEKDWLLATAVFVIFPVGVLPIIRLGRRMRKVSTNTQEQFGVFSTLLNQTFQGMRMVKAYGLQNYERDRADGLIESLFRIVMKSAKVRSAAHPIMETLGGLGAAIVIAYGGYRVINADMQPGAFFAFMTAMFMAYEPMKRLTALNTNLQEALAAAQRYFAVLEVEPEIAEAPDARPLAVTKGEIAFQDVRFSYDGELAAVDGVDLRAPAGKMVALVGPSGAGKSTLINLIPRFYDVDAGRVTIDGQDVRDVTLASLRQAIALVSQEITLFDDSIAANIGYGRPGADAAAIVEAAKLADAHDFIEALPDGYDTVVGEQGVKLSGGQRQRIAIARAMLKDAPILLLDEATSSLDAESERQVQNALRRLMQHRTTMVIAHRLSTVVNADVIYVLDGGRVVEYGAHAELQAQRGAYARLYALQFAQEGDSEDSGDDDPEAAPQPLRAQGGPGRG